MSENISAANVAAASLKRRLEQSPPEFSLPGPHPRYKKAYADAVLGQVEQLLAGYEELQRHADTLQETIKLSNAQAQNAMHESRRLLADVASVAKMMQKALPAPKMGKKADAEESDLKGE